MDLRKMKSICSDIQDMLAGESPAEWYGGLCLAIGFYLKAEFPLNLDEAIELHKDNIISILEEAEKSNNDMMEITGVDLGDIQ